MGKISIALIGAGRVGSSLALALARAGHRIPVIVDADGERAHEVARAVGGGHFGETLPAQLDSTGLVLAAVPDAEVGPLAGKLAASGFLRPGQVLCHTSGFLPASALGAARGAGCLLASLHPMMSFPVRFAPMPLQHPVFFGLEGDQEAEARLGEVVESLGGIPVRLEPDRKALYHAGCVLATGMAASLLGLAQGVFDVLGHREDSQGMVRSLAGSVLENVMRAGPAGSLSGPLVRGEAATVAAHLEALEGAGGRALEAYRALGKALLEMAGGRLEGEARKQMMEILEKRE